MGNLGKLDLIWVSKFCCQFCSSVNFVGSILSVYTEDTSLTIHALSLYLYTETVLSRSSPGKCHVRIWVCVKQNKNNYSTCKTLKNDCSFYSHGNGFFLILEKYHGKMRRNLEKWKLYRDNIKEKLNYTWKFAKNHEILSSRKNGNPEKCFSLKGPHPTCHKQSKMQQIDLEISLI